MGPHMCVLFLGCVILCDGGSLCVSEHVAGCAFCKSVCACVREWAPSMAVMSWTSRHAYSTMLSL